MSKDNSHAVLTSRELIDLAPLELANHREDRFRGDGSRSNLSEFYEADREILLRIYKVLQDVFDEMVRGDHNSRHIRQVLVDHDPQRDLVSAGTRRLGIATLERDQSRHLAQVIHDIRGGALQSLLIRWEMFAALPDNTAGLSAIFFLLRDHLKIMRNCVADLDTARFTADSARKDHGTDLLLEKWTNAEFYGGKMPALIEFDCTYEGTLCESCLEFSALDRIIYNLLNNAARNASDHVVQFHILPTPQHDTVENLRFVIANQVSSDHASRLNAAVPDLGLLFQSGFTTEGHGVGMSIVADFCTQAFGIYDDEKARKERYYGVEWIGDNFVAWFHWPVAGA